MGEAPGDLQPSGVLPLIDAGACAHAILSDASCSSCVDACPSGAWVLDDQGLGLNESRCAGCGICASACPAEAIAFNTGEALISPADPRTAFAGCRHTVPGDGPGQLSCMGVLGVDELMRLYARGVRTIAVPEPSPAGCHCTTPARFDEALGRLNDELVSRDAPGLKVTALAADVWAERARATDAGHDQVDRSRRALFSTLLAGAARDAGEALRGVEIALGGNGNESLFAHVPHLDQLRCTGCDACISICDSQSLTLIKDEAGNECYRVDPGRCTGCGLCVDICAVAAIEVEHLGAGARCLIELSSAQCRSCGAPYHRSAAGKGGDRLCPVCAGKGHHVTRFQVLE